jgi:hypothetical protein
MAAFLSLIVLTWKMERTLPAQAVSCGSVVSCHCSWQVMINSHILLHTYRWGILLSNWYVVSFLFYFFLDLALPLMTYFLLLLFWGYIVTFTKVLTLYHSWIHPLHYSPQYLFQTLKLIQWKGLLIIKELLIRNY